MELTRVRSLPVLPGHPPLARLAAAGAAAVAGSLLVTWALARAGLALFTVPAVFDKLRFATYAPLTVLGVVGAVIAWALVSRYSPSPVRLLGRLAVLVTVLLLVPDVLLLPQADEPAGPVVMLMIMHIAIAVVSYLALVRLAPVAVAAPVAERERSVLAR